MNIKYIIDKISNHGNRVSDKDMIAIMLLYYGAVLMNRYEVKKNIEHMNINIQCYAFCFASSGIGKGHNLSIIEKLFGLESYPEQMKVMMKHFNKANYDKKMEKFVPQSTTVSVDGTREGLFSVATSVKYSGFGSLNLLSEEILDNIVGSKDMIQKLKEGYDGRWKAKVVQGDKDSKPQKDINGLAINFLGLGSNDSISKETANALESLITRGMLRRSLVLDSKLTVEKRVNQSISFTDIIDHFKKIDDKEKEMYKERVFGKQYNETGNSTKFMIFDDESIKRIDEIDTLLVERSQKDELDKTKSFDTGSMNLIIDNACIKTYIEGRKAVLIDDLNWSYALFLRTRQTITDTFSSVSEHKIIYKVLTIKQNLTHSDFIQIIGGEIIPKGNKAFADIMVLVSELAYRDNKELKMGSGNVTRYSVSELKATNLKKLKMSFSIDDLMEKSIKSKPVYLDFEDFPDLAKSYFREEIDEETGEVYNTGVQSFTLCHYDSSPKTEPHGHRRKDSFKEGQVLIAFDIDGTMSISVIKGLLAPYTYCLYTTRSHNSLKSEFRDRFRVLVPTKNEFFVNPEQHKQMYENIVTYLGFECDMAVKNISRLWFTNRHAKVSMNYGELFDVSPFLPDTNHCEDFMKNFIVKDNSSNFSLNEIDIRIDGEIKWALPQIRVGTLDEILYRVASFIRDITNGDLNRTREELEGMRNKLNFPMKFVDKIMRSIGESK